MNDICEFLWEENGVVAADARISESILTIYLFAIVIDCIVYLISI